MEIFIKEGKMIISKTKDNDITTYYTEKDKHSMNCYKSVTLIEKQYNAVLKTNKNKKISKFNFNKINCDNEKNNNICKDKLSSLPQIVFNNKYNQEFKIIGDIPRKRIYNFIKKRSKYMKKNNEYPLLIVLYFDTNSAVSNKFMNTWRYISDYFEDNEDIKFVALNCQQNMNNCLTFSIIPHIQFNLQYSNKVIDYDGEFILGDIMEFIHKLLYEFKNNNEKL